MSEKCICPLAGWCERHQMRKIGRLYELCQMDTELGESYRRMWDNQVAQAKAEQEIPSLLTQAGNLVKSVVNHVKNGLTQADDNTKRIRLDMCESCDRLDKSTRRCQECGCFVTVKSGWASETCPLGKWPEVVKEEPPTGWAKPDGGCGCNKK